MTLDGLYTAIIESDADLGSNVITLRYCDPQRPARDMSISIAPEFGSNLFRFRVGEHDIIYCNREVLKQRGFTGNFVLWPLPNRVRDCRYSYQGQHYSLEQFKQEARPNGNEVLIHGLVYDRVWQYEQPVIEEGSARVTTFIDITPQSPYYDAYPFESRFSLTYTLSQNGVGIEYVVHNQGQRDLPFGFALHPYFQTLTGKEQTMVSLPADTVMEADETLLPTGRLLDTRGVMYSMFDLRSPVPVSTLRLDHVYTALHPGEPAIIDYSGLDMQLQITATDDFTHAVIYTLGGDEPYLCLEHQTCSTDAINFHHQGAERQAMAHLLEVSPGQTTCGSLQYTIHFR
jgi:aldose 1-epimerase